MAHNHTHEHHEHKEVEASTQKIQHEKDKRTAAYAAEKLKEIDAKKKEQSEQLKKAEGAEKLKQAQKMREEVQIQYEDGEKDLEMATDVVKTCESKEKELFDEKTEAQQAKDSSAKTLQGKEAQWVSAAGAVKTCEGSLAAAQKRLASANENDKQALQHEIAGLQNQLGTLRSKEQHARKEREIANADFEEKTDTLNKIAELHAHAVENTKSAKAKKLDIEDAQKKINARLEEMKKHENDAEKVAEEYTKALSAASERVYRVQMLVQREEHALFLTDVELKKVKDYAKARKESVAKAMDAIVAEENPSKQQALYDQAIGQAFDTVDARYKKDVADYENKVARSKALRLQNIAVNRVAYKSNKNGITAYANIEDSVYDKVAKGSMTEQEAAKKLETAVGIDIYVPISPDNKIPMVNLVRDKDTGEFRYADFDDKAGIQRFSVDIADGRFAFETYFPEAFNESEQVKISYLKDGSTSLHSLADLKNGKEFRVELPNETSRVALEEIIGSAATLVEVDGEKAYLVDGKWYDKKKGGTELVIHSGQKIKILSQSRHFDDVDGKTRMVLRRGEREDQITTSDGVEMHVYKSGFVHPLLGYAETSQFGYRVHPIYKTRRLHTGLDIGAPAGAKVRAVMDGKVIHAGWNGGYGYEVVIQHPNGLQTRYAHNSSLKVQTGQTIKKGEVISGVGTTGSSTGNHLHFEVLKNGAPVNPKEYLA